MTQNLDSKRFAFSMIGAFATIFMFESVFHGVVMMPAYAATASVWRIEQEMRQLLPVSLLRQLLEAGILSWIFIRFFEAKGTADGLRYGLYLGLLMGIVQFSSVVYLPIPFWMAGAWLAGQALLGTLIGLVLARIYSLTTAS